MKQFMYITRDLDNLQRTEEELEEKGVDRSHIQVLSEDEAALHLRDLPEVPEFSKLDIFRYGIRGAMIGTVLSAIVLGMVYAFGWVNAAGWAPFIFLCIVVIGFCTWEGGLMGIARINHRFEKFKDALQRGAHLLIVNVNQDEVPRVKSTLKDHPGIHQVQ